MTSDDSENIKGSFICFFCSTIIRHFLCDCRYKSGPSDNEYEYFSWNRENILIITENLLEQLLNECPLFNIHFGNWFDIMNSYCCHIVPFGQNRLGEVQEQRENGSFLIDEYKIISEWNPGNWISAKVINKILFFTYVDSTHESNLNRSKHQMQLR